MQIVCIYGPADATASETPSSPVSYKSRLVLPFWYRLTQVVLEKRPFNGRSRSSSLTIGSDCVTKGRFPLIPGM